ncbi:sodium:solute symporter [Thermodesulfobacteriota bacterium]
MMQEIQLVTFKPIEFAIVILYIIACIGVGIFASRRALKSEEEYWVAHRFLGDYAGAFAIFAVVGSASTVMGICGLGYRFGIPFVAATAASFALQFPLVAYLTARPLKEHNICTLGDYFKLRVGGKPVLFIYALLSLLFMGAYIIPQLKAAGLLGQWLMGFDYKTMVLIIGFTFIVYASIGGMWAITITDIFQGVLMIFGGLILALVVLIGSGGIGDLMSQAIAVRPQLAKFGWPVLSIMGLALTWAFWGIVAPMTVMRVLTMRSKRSTRRSMTLGSVFAFLSVGFTAIIVVLAATSIAGNNLKQADMAFLIVMQHWFPPIISGFLVASLFAAIMSSTDSFLLACSASIARDIYKGVINPNATEKQVVRLGFICMWIVGIIVVLMAIYPLPLISIMTAMVATGLISSFMGPLLMSIYWKGSNRHGVFFGILGGFIFYFILKQFKLVPFLSEMLFAVPFSFLVVYVVSILTKGSTAPDNS